VPRDVQPRAGGCLPGACRVNRGGPRLELADVARGQARLRKPVDLIELRGSLLRERGACLRERQIGKRGLDVGDQIEPGLFEPGGNAVDRDLGDRHTPRSLPENLDRPFQRGLELLRADREQQRQHRIAKQPGLDEIGTCKSQIGQLDLKLRVVPERDRHRFFLAQPVVELDARRKRRASGEVGAKRHAGAFAELGRYRPRRRDGRAGGGKQRK
jgi:hypothetical protein